LADPEQRPDELQLTSSDLEISAEAPEPEPVPADVGTFVSGDQVVAWWDATSQSWMRLAPEQALNAGQELIVLPTYRPKFALANGLEVTFCGGTGRVRVEGFVEAETPCLAVPDGRMVLASGSEPESRFRLLAGGRPWTLTLRQPQSVVALEIQHPRVPGTHPETSESHTMIRVWAVRGPIQLQVDDQPASEIEPGAVFTAVDHENGSPTLASELPVWLDSLPLEPIERDASRLLEPLFDEQQSIESSLNQALNDRRRELVALAAQCLTHFEQFGPTVAALNDATQRPWWGRHFDSLQRALSSGHATAAKVREALELQRAPDAPELYRLLWGFSDSDLRGGSDVMLVQYLYHDSLDFRVLAIENLSRITGKTLLYYAWASDRQRRASAQRWLKLQKEGQILHHQPPFAPPE
jgi:hypothetical protein